MYYYDVLMRGAGGPNTTLTYQSPIKLQLGSIVLAPLGKRQVMGLVTADSKRPKFTTKTIELATPEVLPPQSRKLLTWLSTFYGVSEATALRQIIPAKLPAKRLPPQTVAAKPRGLGNLKLSPSQRTAVQSISRGQASTYLLHGATAAGKTLIYRELAKAALKTGRSVLILVPEIAMTPQVAADFADLTEQVFVSHSGLSEQERQRIWLYSLQQRSPFIIVGPRSSLFYPFHELGLIVVDEVHEQSYKQEQAPTYQAQTVAARLSELHKTKLVLGSATPRVSDYWLAKTRHVPILTLAKHVPIRPHINVVDQRQKSGFNASRLLSTELIRLLGQVLKSQGQSLLYLNRRGTAAMAICADCGWVPLCPRCSLPVSLHHDAQRLVCHQCGWRDTIPVNCPACGGSEVIYRGAGTKAVEREIGRLLPQARVKRFDSDNPPAESFSRLYQQVHDQEVDIIIGTQSLAHGLDLPALNLVGVVSADTELYLPDFTASERTFQLLFQVIGRAGRSGGGQVVIQSHNPAHPAIVHAVNQDYPAYYAHEIATRQLHRYPPFGYLLGLVVHSKSAQSGQRKATNLAGTLNRQFGFKRILGPAPAYHFKRGGYYRHVLVVKSAQRPRLVEAARYVSSQADWRADLDPINLLF